VAAPLRYILIGNPDNRRITLFQRELELAGQPPAIVIPYLDLLRRPEVLADLPDEPFRVRQDSAGESFEVERELLTLGFEDAVASAAQVITPAEIAALVEDRGRILAPRQYHLGFLRLLERLAAIYEAHPRWIIESPPAAIAELFDKRATSRRWRGLRIPVPESIDDVRDFDTLRAQALEREWRAVYVKVSCSSSASCLAVYHPGSRDWLMTTIEHAGATWYNSLKLRRYTGARAREIIDFLLGEGSQVERSVPKARFQGAPFDLRVVTIDDEPMFTVVRQSRHPITNLHLGGWRGDWDALRAAMPPPSRSAIEATCRQVAAAAGCSRIGIDVLVEPGLGSHMVLEANAFGDLLPNLERDGLSVYGWQVRAASASAGHERGPARRGRSE